MNSLYLSKFNILSFHYSCIFFCYLFERTVISMCLNDLTCFIHTVHTSIVRNLVGLVWINQGHCIPLNMIGITEFYTAETLWCFYVRINLYPNRRVSVECLQGRRGKWVDDWHEQMNSAGVKTPPWDRFGALWLVGVRDLWWGGRVKALH